MTTSPYSFQITSGESNDVPEPNARHALAGEADPADALPAFEHAVVTNANRTQLQHFSRARPGNDNAATCRISWPPGQAALVYATRLSKPDSRLVAQCRLIRNTRTL